MYSLVVFLCLLLQPEVTGPIDSIMERIENRMKDNETLQSTRYHGMLNILQGIKDRPMFDSGPILDKFQEVTSSIRSLREESDRRDKTMGPIRDGFDKLTKLVYACTVLCCVVFLMLVFDRLSKLFSAKP